MVAPIVAAAGGALLNIAARAAASTLVRSTVIGLGVWWGGNYIAREGMKEAAETSGVASVATDKIVSDVEDAFLVSVKRLAVPAIVGYVLYNEFTKP